MIAHTLKERSSWWESLTPHAILADPIGMMNVALTAAQNGISDGCGPFASAVFEVGAWDDAAPKNQPFSKRVKTWKLLSVGANLVSDMGSAHLHGEIVGSIFASERLKTRGAKDAYDFWTHQLAVVTTSAPCAMCENFLIWAKPRLVIAGTTTSDTAEHLSFDECKTPDALQAEKHLSPQDEPWVKNLQSRGIEVIAGIKREEIIETVFKAYHGPIYTPGG